MQDEKKVLSLLAKNIYPGSEKCWCKSGILFSKCHKELSRKQRWSEDRIHAEYKKNFYTNDKCYFDNCHNPPISKSHTVQSSKLREISSDACVIKIEARGQDEDRFPRRGVNSRSVTYPLFCSNHDNDIFLPIEKSNPILPSKEHSALFGLRASVMEMHLKKRALYTTENIILELGSGFNPFEQYFQYKENKWLIDEYKKGVWDCEYNANKFTEIIKSNDFSKIRGLFIELDELPWLSCTFSTQPELNFKGQVMQDLWQNGKFPLEMIAFSLVPNLGKGIAIFSWIEGNVIAEELIDTFLALNNTEIQAHALLNYILEYSDNNFYSPDSFEKLLPHEQEWLHFKLTEPNGFRKFTSNRLLRYNPLIKNNNLTINNIKYAK